MIVVPEVTIERIAVAEGHGESLRDLAFQAASAALAPDQGQETRDARRETGDERRETRDARHDSFGGVIVASFSGERRFPALAVEIASKLGLPPSAPAFDLQLACSAYPYAVYLGGRIAADTGKRVLVVDGDVQSRLVDANDHDTGLIFSDAVTATVLRADAAFLPRAEDGTVSFERGGGAASSCSHFDFYSRFNDEALSCGETGPIRMKGFDVFSFVATDVSRFLKGFLSSLRSSSHCTFHASLLFAPHQANPYMIRQLAKSLGLSERLLTLDESKKNPGSCSIPMTLAVHPECRGQRVLLAGFGAGYSAAAATVRIADGFSVC